ncbi:apolipoprotein A-IV-like isoform X2 [Rana temporaria]|nr:apolipoprotein A-IV-like isoform X2 [Rana temporaria]XP_040181297.1 apolipoprotein A-IV-like isoform X2 [Rana temporaria]
MLVKMIAVTLVFTITGSNAEATSKNLASAFLDYAAQVVTATKNSASVYDFTKQVSDLLEKNMKSLDKENLLKAFSTFADSINKPLTYDKAKQPMLDELEQLRTTLSASTLEVNRLFSMISEELLIKLSLYFDNLQAKVEKNTLAVSQKLESITVDLNTPLITSIDSMQMSLALNLQNLEGAIVENLEEVRVNVNVYHERVSEKLRQQSLLLIKHLSPYAADMQESLTKQFKVMCFQIKKLVDQMQTNIFVTASQLKEQVGFFKSSLLAKTYLDVSNVKKTTNICLSDMSQKITLFKDTVVLYGETLKKTLIEGLENIKKETELYDVQDSTKVLNKNIQEKILSFINSTLLSGIMSDN